MKRRIGQSLKALPISPKIPRSGFSWRYGLLWHDLRIVQQWPGNRWFIWDRTGPQVGNVKLPADTAGQLGGVMKSVEEARTRIEKLAAKYEVDYEIEDIYEVIDHPPIPD